MNSLTAAESLMRVYGTAAHGGDDDDGYTISNDDWLTIRDVARWLLAGAIERGLNEGMILPGDLPTVNIDELHLLATVQAERRYESKSAAAAAMGVNKSTFWRWRNKAEADCNPAGGIGAEANSQNQARR